LALFERYYFPLQARLRPAMRGLIIALLPALEEEGSEYFDKVSCNNKLKKKGECVTK
jgi:hypothetical protein